MILFSICGRTRKASITTGVVERTESIKSETIDRLSPLTSTLSTTFLAFPAINDATAELEKYVEMDIDSQLLRTPNEAPDTTYSHLSPACGNTRRHTVGPGDVEHEQALANPTATPINFKFGPDQGPHFPINLPMLQNQPLHNFTMKNQHLLKPPTAMEASECRSIRIFQPKASKRH